MIIQSWSLKSRKFVVKLGSLFKWIRGFHSFIYKETCLVFTCIRYVLAWSPTRARACRGSNCGLSKEILRLRKPLGVYVCTKTCTSRSWDALPEDTFCRHFNLLPGKHLSLSPSASNSGYPENCKLGFIKAQQRGTSNLKFKLILK